MGGGVSQVDTFDPKPEAPVSVKGEFKSIDTAIPGVKFTEVCPTMAKEAQRYGLLSGWNPKNGSHGTADQYVMSGRPVNQSVRYPCYGSVVSYHHGFKTAMSPFVQLGTSLDKRFGGGSAGILGLAHSAFETLIRRSSRPSASPLSRDFAASAAPSFKSLALPATINDAAALKTAISR